jgi:hypothetical protein
VELLAYILTDLSLHYNIIFQLGEFHVLTAASMNMTVFWDVSPLSGDECLTMEAANTSETSVNVYQTTRCKIQEDSNLHIFLGFVGIVSRFDFRKCKLLC